VVLRPIQHKIGHFGDVASRLLNVKFTEISLWCTADGTGQLLFKVGRSYNDCYR